MDTRIKGNPGCNVQVSIMSFMVKSSGILSAALAATLRFWNKSS